MADIESACVEQPLAHKRNYERQSLVVVIAACGVLAVCAILWLASPTPTVVVSTPPVERRLSGRVKVGAHTAGDISSLENDIGRDFDISMMFSTIGSASGRKESMRNDMYSNHDIVMNLEFDDDLDSINGGRYNGDIDNFVNALNDIKGTHGKTIWLRPLYEFNGNWNNYGIYHGNNNKDKFKQAYRSIVQRIKNGVHYDSHVKFQLGYNCDNPGGHEYDSFKDMYPGSDVVDMITCNAYNRDGLEYHWNDWESFYYIFVNGWHKMQSIGSGKPLGFGETSTVGSRDGHTKAQWIRDAAYEFQKGNFKDVVQVDWFLENSKGDWALNSWDDKQAMKDFMDRIP